MAVVWKNLDTGIRAKEHATRKHGVKPDLYFVLRYRVDGVAKQEALGWSSEGWTLAKARAELAKLKEAKRTGEGQTTLKEKREKAKQERQAEAAKLSVAALFSIYQEQKGKYANRATDNASFKHFAYLHHRLPESIRTHELSTITKTMESNGKKPQTIRNALELLRRIINFGVKQELIIKPQGLRFIMPKIDNQKTEVLTEEQAATLLAALDADPNRTLAAMMKLVFCTGIRKSAALALKWQDLDFQRGHITLRGEEAKSGKTTTIPMTAAAREVLQSIVMQGSPYLFPSPETGEPYKDIRRFLDRIRKAADLPEDFRPLHGLRHSYASWLASSGKVDLFTLQKLMTHGSPQMTQRYAHLADEAVKRAASVIDDCLNDVARVAVNAEPLPLQGKEALPKVIQFKRK